ncbi:MAG: hypothetical protein Q9227_004925 [Pyrenula ochraceoflavens]
MVTTLSVASDRNPSHLPPRYEIRRLTLEHIPWALAVVGHSNVFCSPLWAKVYPKDPAGLMYEVSKAGDYLVRHQVLSGMSFGVFDLDYKFKRPESEKTGGALYFDESDPSADSSKILEQMDNPLVSVALAYDQTNPLDMEQMGPILKCLPLFGLLYGILEGLDKRDPSWKATEPRQVLMRNATSTRADYEGEGLMKKLAQFLMREADYLGYRGIQIECAHDAVCKTWLNPPAPFKGELVARFDCKTYEMEDEEAKKEGREGVMVKPFAPSEQVISKVFVHL